MLPTAIFDTENVGGVIRMNGCAVDMSAIMFIVNKSGLSSKISLDYILI